MFPTTRGSPLAGKYDSRKARAAPPPATPVSFPDTSCFSKQSRWTDGSNPDLFRLYANSRKVVDIHSDHWEALNIRSVQIENVEDLFEAMSRGSSFIPPRSWVEPRSTGDQAITPESRVLFNSRPSPSHDHFYTLSKELLYENVDAFAALTRTTRENRPIPRLTHFRRFWEGLDSMSYYWDASADEYMPAKENETSDTTSEGDKAECVLEEHEPKKRKTWNPAEPVSTNQLLISASNSAYSNLSVQSRTHSEPSIQQPVRNDTQQEGDARKEDAQGTYRGHRIGNGAGMPEQYRIDTIRAFVEPIIWAFGFTLSPHRRQPVVAIKTLHVPVRMSGAVWRPPLAREKAKMGWLEGPVLGISCRSETDFEHRPESSLLDVLRESGALLSVAQERAREKKKEVRPGENQWWTTVARWGGGSGGEVGEAVASGAAYTDDPTGIVKDLETHPSRESRGRPTSRGAGSSRKLNAADAWKILRPGTGFWDPRVEYSAIGREAQSEYDQVFLVSSLNHHISILKLSVHSAYLEYLLTGMMPMVSPEDESWSSPEIVRSPWFSRGIDEQKFLDSLNDSFKFYVSELSPSATAAAETNYKTVTAKANVTGIYTPPTPTDPYAHLTWEHDGVTLTYPTTYVQFFGLRGGLFTPVVTAAVTSCAVKDEVLQLGTSDPTGLIVEVPARAKIDLAHPTAVAAPPAVHSFLNAIPAISSQFSGTNVKDCAWNKIPAIRTTVTDQFTEALVPVALVPVGASSSAVATNQKVTVSVLTQVTAKQQVITVSSDKDADQANEASPTPNPEPPTINTENKATSAVVVNPSPNTAAAQPQQPPTNSPGVVSNIAGILAGGTLGAQTTGNGDNPTQGAASGTQAGSMADQGGTITAAGGVAATGLPGSQQGNGASPTPLVLNIGGQQTTIAPTVIAGSQGSPSITAFIVAPGKTLTAGGAAITIPGSIILGTSFPGTVVSAPKATGPYSGSSAPGAPLVVTIGGKATTIQPTIITGSQGPITGFVVAPGSTLFPEGSAIVISGITISGSTFAGTTLSLSKGSGLVTGSKTGSLTLSKTSISTTSNTLRIGDAIASGIGFTSVPDVATGGASHHEIDVPLWCLGLLSGAVGAVGGVAVWLS
ncbi:hypothetical protein BLS_009841 [Venturia inaequalis]|uniref:Uncharacterized protein n=1 Tax=Venturia inaequalis TaxID=5025 RepID=A0A8H3YZ09_VENIN|nr:hypothetical protein BLS_009841 [Venturia inaequalis]